MTAPADDVRRIPADAGTILVPMARRAIEDHLTGPREPFPGGPEWLAEPGATFVTLTLHGRLRGCIGSLQAWRPVGDDVVANARAAAFRDPRFRPVEASELEDLHVEVSLLTAAEPLPFADRADALVRLRPGVDGVILSAGGRRGTFLPQVWEQLPDPHDFLEHLVRKAGLPAGYWGPDVRLERYTVRKWSE